MLILEQFDSWLQRPQYLAQRDALIVGDDTLTLCERHAPDADFKSWRDEIRRKMKVSNTANGRIEVNGRKGNIE